MELLAADIGGTSSRFAHFTCSPTAEPEMVEQVWLTSAEAKSFSDLLDQLEQSEFRQSLADFDTLVFAVAGPITEGVFCRPPNISWDIDLRGMQHRFAGGDARLINDFLAQAYSARSPVGRSAELVVQGSIEPAATIAVVGAGTGLGKAILVPDECGGFVGVPSEGGHASFAPESEDELEFFRFLLSRSRSSYPSWEEVVSGRALSTIHEFFTKEQLAPVDVAATFDTTSPTLELASRLYGRVCRNFALETLARGGVYIAGGVAAKNPILLTHPEFEQSFVNSAVHGELLQEIPVYLMDNQESGLWGAAYYGWERSRRGK